MPSTSHSKALKGLTSRQKLAVISLSVVIEQVQSLPKPDRDEFVTLMQLLRDAPDQEERDSLQVAMEEILAQTPITAETIDLSAAPPASAFARHVGETLSSAGAVSWPVMRPGRA